MPLFITDEELESLRSNDNNVTFIVSKADSFITNLQRQLETVKAQSEASSITAEQTCSLLEQKYISLSSDFEKLESQNAELNAAIERNLEELAVVKSEKHRIHLESIEKDGTIERLSAEVSEIHKSKRQLLGMIEQKDTEITEKNTTIKSYLDKIVNLTEAAALKQSQLHEREAELARSQATCARLSQEKELIEKHNVWLNEELTTKVHDLIQVRKAHAEAEADISTKLADAEKSYNECSSSLKWNKERVKELEGKLASLQEELCYSKTTAAENEEHFTAELSTVSKLVELYKESSEEWSRKAGDFEGVIKALETHLAQVENDYREKLEKEVSARLLHEKAAADLKEKLNKCDVEIENYRKANELSLLPISSFTEERWTDRGGAADGLQDSDHMIVPKIPIGVSGTALAASLLRDGWSLAKMYEKYQEAVDALRHESMGRKQSQAVLERVLYEIEQKAELILDERAEHERMVEAYSAMNQKLESSTSEQVKLEGMIQELKAEIRRAEREYDMAQKDIVDLQKQVTVLLKECRDIQLRCGSTGDICIDQGALLVVDANDLLNTERVISERLTYKDINELVEHNVKLRSLVRSLSDQNEKRDTELREMFEMELRKQTEEASSKVAVVLQRAEEQGQMIEALHRSVAMYKRLYEEAQKFHASHPHSTEPVPDSRRTDVMLHLEDSQDTIKKAHDQLVERVKHLEEQLDMSRKETISLRLERDKLSMESKFAQEKLDSFMKEFEHMREEMNGLRARNVEFSQLVVDYQRKVRESSDSLQAAEELSRKLTMEVSFLKHEKESLLNSEKRALDEARNLSERLGRLQVSMETEHCVEAAREETRLMEKRKQEEYTNKLERDLAQAMKELQEKRDIVQTLTIERQNAMTRKEELEEQLVDALRERALAETRAAVAEMRYSDMEANTRASHSKGVVGGDGPSTSMTTVDVQNETVGLHQLKEEIERLKEEEKANKDHMLQYKNIAQVNELALKQVESAHERYKTEADRIKKSHEDEVLSLRERISELENGFSVKFKETATVVAGKEEALASALAEIDILKAESSAKISQIVGMEVQISSLKEDLEQQHQRWRDAQNNYERQVILQSDTIQELTKTSRALSLLQDEISQLRKLSDTQKSENDILKEKLASEISLLAKLKDEAERKFNEVNEQNKILHSRLESLHIKLADNERTSVGSSGSPAGDAQGDNGLQTVVTYLRRSKEIAETEISLLRQEKLRLQSQLESALRASETAQAQLHAERVKSRELLFSDEEFKALQIQVRELNLLRESNMQLREENKHNFEECQRLRELAQKVSGEMDHLKTVVEEKKIEVDSCRKEIEIQGVEKRNLENRIAELLGMYKNIDIEDYSRMKEDFHQMQVKLKTVEAELDECRKLLSEKQDSITSLELQLKSTRVELAERETRIKESLQTEATLKLELEKQRRATAQYKRKFENLTKEKEEWTKEKQTLVKQEESRQGKRPLGDTSSEQAMKEKDARIQILERTIEREREELRKEKEEHRNEKEEHRKEKDEHLKEKEEHHKEKEKHLKEKEEHRKEKEEHRKEKAMRLKSQKIFEGCLNRANQERAKLVDELEKHKQVCRQESGIVETASYYKAVDDLNQCVKPFVSDDFGAPDNALDTSRTERPAAAGEIEPPPSNTITHSSTSLECDSFGLVLAKPVIRASQVVAQTLPAQPLLGSVVGPSQTKPAEEKGRRATLVKPQPEIRKLQRKLVRPNLEPRPHEASGDTEMAESEGSVHAEGKKDPALPTNLTSARKRGASEPGSELREESEILPDTSNVLLPPLPKKFRSELPQEGNEGVVSVLAQSHDVSSTMDESSDAAGDQPHAANDSVIVTEKDDVCATAELDAESKESPLDVLPASETQNNSMTDASEELFDNIREPEDGLGEGLKEGEEQDPQQTLVETESDREEGELLPDVGEEQDGVDASYEITSSVPGEVKHDLASVADVPPAVDEELDFTAGELFETTSSTVIVDEKIDTGEGAEVVVEDSYKSTNEYDQGLETEKSRKAAFGAVGSSSPSNVSDHTASDQSNITGTPAVEGEESPAGRSTTINITERALAQAELRRKGLVGSPTISKDSSTTAPKRGGARGVRGTRGIRGRGARGRRPTSNDGQG